MKDGGQLLLRALPLAMIALTADARADRVDDLVNSEMGARHIMGAALAVVKDGRVVKEHAYGLANVELGVKANIDTVFEIGSVTKQFTATLIMMLAEEGKLSLDSPLSTLLPGTPDAWAGITLGHMLGHTSGLVNYTDLPGFEVWEGLDSPKFVAKLATHPLEFKPGDKYEYCNSGYALAGYVIERLCGKPYRQVLRERIFEPLGMAASGDRDPRQIVPGRAAGYDWVDGRLVNRSGDITELGGAGAIASTVPDLVKWNSAVDSCRLLKPESRETMWTSGVLNDGKPTGYGLGWRIGEHRGERLISHSGSTSGFSAAIEKFVDRNVTVIVLTNCETLNNATEIARKVAEEFVKFKQD
jgi:CubicO group peptidase (beta-lactamase class C family)